ncbi:12550_t:CDS:2, partial [Cetraspora pellucida]
ENEQTNYRRPIYYSDDNKKIIKNIQIMLSKQQKILFDKDQRSFLKEHEFVIGKDKNIVDKSLILQLPEKYFDMYCNANYDFYINEREIVYIVKKNDDKVLAIFMKCVLKKYLKDNEMKHRFNTCPCCGKLKFCFIEKINFFGHENKYEQELYQETLNQCDVYNSPYTNHV